MATLLRLLQHGDLPNGAVPRIPVTRRSGPIEGEQVRLPISNGEQVIYRADSRGGNGPCPSESEQ